MKTNVLGRLYRILLQKWKFSENKKASKFNKSASKISNNSEETLIIGVSATALFDMRESDARFRETLESGDKHKAFEDYLKEVEKNKNTKLLEGTAFPLIKALLNLNKYQREKEKPLVMVILLTKNSPETSKQILFSIKTHDLDISRFAFTGGDLVANYASSLGMDLFLTTSENEAQQITDSRSCAAAVISAPPERTIEPSLGQTLFGPKQEEIRIAFDGDGVLFSEESEKIYQEKGLEAFHKHEKDKANIPMPDGPFKRLILKLMKVQKRLPIPLEWSPIRISLVTARNAPTHTRVLNTLREWGVYVDQAFFLGGLKKTPILEILQPHIFFDDQEVHLKDSSRTVPCARVLYPSDSSGITQKPNP